MRQETRFGFEREDATRPRKVVLLGDRRAGQSTLVRTFLSHNSTVAASNH